MIITKLHDDDNDDDFVFVVAFVFVGICGRYQFLLLNFYSLDCGMLLFCVWNIDLIKL
jgi:hypothetical protein